MSNFEANRPADADVAPSPLPQRFPIFVMLVLIEVKREKCESTSCVKDRGHGGRGSSLT